MLILLLAWLFLQTSYGQNKALPIALNYLSNILGTEIQAERINISFFDEIQLDDVVIFDSEGDTLVYAQKLDGNIGFFSFMNKKLLVDNLTLQGTRFNLNEVAKGTFNYDHIISHLSTNNEESKNDTSNSWNIDLGALELEDVQFYLSGIGSELNLTIPKLRGDLKEFSLQESLFHFESLITEGVVFSYDKDNQVQIGDVKEVTLPALPISLLVDHLSVSSDGISYNTNDPLIASPQFDPNHIDIEKLELEGKGFQWTDSIQLNLKELSVLFADGFEITKLSSDLSISNHAANFDQTRILTSNSDVLFSGRMKYEDFDILINNFSAVKSDFTFKKSFVSTHDITYFIDANSISFLDLNSLNDTDFGGHLTLDSGSLKAKNIYLKSGNDLTLEGSFSTTNILNPNSTTSFFSIKNFSANQDYFEKLFPSFKYPEELNDIGTLKGNMAGNINQDEVYFKSINIASSNNSKLSGSGKIYSLQSANGPEVEFTFRNLESNLNLLFTDKLVLPDELKRLDDFKYSGLISGNLNNIITDGKLSSSLGNVDLDARINFFDNYSDANYEGYVNTEDFDLGTMLDDPTYGIVNFEGNIKGHGLTIDSLETMIDGHVKSIYYDGNTYEDITLDGAYKDKSFEGIIDSKDPKLNLKLNGKVDLSGSRLTMDVVMDMKHFDLKEIGLSDSLMVLGGIFKGKVNGNSVDDILGNGSIENFKITTHKGVYNADSLIHIKAEESGQKIKSYVIESPFLDGEIKGKIEPSSLVRFVKNYIKAYIPLEIGYDENIEDNLDKYFEEHEDQNFEFSATTKDINPFLIPFLGDDFSVNKASMGAFFSSEKTKLDIKGKIDSLLYKGVLLQRGSYFFTGRKSFIDGGIFLEDISMDDEILIPQTNILTVLDNKIADFNLVLANEDDEERLNLSGDLTRTDEYLITFSDSVLLNGFNWGFSPYNQVIFGDYGLFMQDLRLSKADQSVTIYTDENENGEAIEVLFDNFILSELTAIIDKENEYFEGKIDGSLMINSLYSKPFITADLGIKNVTIADHQAGDLALTANQDVKSNSVKSMIRLSGPQNDATLFLDYGIEQQTTKGELDIGKLEMAIIDPYLTDIFINSEGHVNGKIDIGGDLHNLDLKGILRTHDVKTTPVFTNSRYAVMDTDVTFSDTKIDFGTVELKDKNGNSAYVTGKIDHRNLRHSVVDLKARTDNFEFLNTTENENELFFGNVNISANVTVNGPIDDIKIDGSVNAINSSNLSVSPLSLEEDLLRDDFIIYSGDPRKIPADSLEVDVNAKDVAIPFDVDLKVNVGEDSKFTMILNPITGDKLTCHGKSDLVLKLSKDGNMELFGTYTVTQGEYVFSFGPITKEFIIQPGSKVELNGDPLEGTLDVEAIYIANTAVFDLLQLETELTDAEKSEARRKRDINVLLSLTKSIQSPEIKMDLKTDENELATSITDILERKLNQLRTNQDELNNQVFGLLLFNNFSLAKNSETDLTETTADFAIRSLGDLVTAQLNKLADGLIEGFELNIDINPYSSNYLALGQEGLITEFGIDIKKSLFDSRLTIRAGTNINLESSSSASNFNTIAGDFLVEYKLTENGNFIVKAFRKSSVDRLGETTSLSKNGASIFLRKEFGEIKQKKN